MKPKTQRRLLLPVIVSLLTVLLIGCGQTEGKEEAAPSKYAGASTITLPDEKKEAAPREKEASSEKKETKRDTEPAEEPTETREPTDTETEAEEKAETETEQPPIGESVTIIGDSISFLTEDLMKEALPGVDIYCQSGKVFDYRFPDNPGGLEVIGEVKENGDLREIVVYALGSNNRDSVATPALNDEMMDALHEITGNRRVYLVTNYDLRHPEVYDRNNAAIYKAADTYRDWHVIDWVGTVEGTGDPEKYILDEGEAAVGDMQVHPTDPDGRQLWVDMIVSALETDTAQTRSADENTGSASDR